MISVSSLCRRILYPAGLVRFAMIAQDNKECARSWPFIVQGHAKQVGKLHVSPFRSFKEKKKKKIWSDFPELRNFEISIPPHELGPPDDKTMKNTHTHTHPQSDTPILQLPTISRFQNRLWAQRSSPGLACPIDSILQNCRLKYPAKSLKSKTWTVTSAERYHKRVHEDAQDRLLRHQRYRHHYVCGHGDIFVGTRRGRKNGPCVTYYCSRDHPGFGGGHGCRRRPGVGNNGGKCPNRVSNSNWVYKNCHPRDESCYLRVFPAGLPCICVFISC